MSLRQLQFNVFERIWIVLLGRRSLLNPYIVNTGLEGESPQNIGQPRKTD
jgi:hypothetical protein